MDEQKKTAEEQIDDEPLIGQISLDELIAELRF